MLITTKRVKCDGLNPKTDYHYFVTMTDGKNIAMFISDGSDKIKLSDFSRFENSDGTAFVGYSNNPGILRYLYGKNHFKSNTVKEQKKQAIDFIKSCLTFPAIFNGNQHVYIL